MTRTEFSRRTAALGLLLVLLAGAALQGCGGTQVVDTTPIFFPPAPNPPRVQYLTSFDDETDIVGTKQKLALALLGGAEADKTKVIGKPYGVSTRKGKIYVCDIGWSDVLIIDPAKKTFEGLKGNKSMGKLKKPVNVALDEEGRMYVVDIMRKEIVVYHPNGDFYAAFGRQLDMKPADIAVDGRFVYLLDLKHSEIKVLDRKTGKHVRSIGKRTAESPGLAGPTNMTLAPDGFLYVTNIVSGQVVKLDRDGHVLSSFGQLGDAPTMFARPKGIDVDDEGRIYVIDGGNQNVQVFNKQNRLLIFFGEPGLPRGSLNLPVGISVTKDNLDFFQKFAAPGFKLESLVFVTNQYGADKLAVYGIGRSKDATYPETAN